MAPRAITVVAGAMTACTDNPLVQGCLWPVRELYGKLYAAAIIVLILIFCVYRSKSGR